MDRRLRYIKMQLLLFIFGWALLELLCHDRNEAERVLGPFNRHPFECGMLITATSTCISLCWLTVVRGNTRKTQAMSTAFISSISFVQNFMLHQGYSPVVLNYFGRFLFPIRIISWAATLPIITHISGQLSDFSPREVLVYEVMSAFCVLLGLIGIWTTKYWVLITATSLSFWCYFVLLYGFCQMFSYERFKPQDAASLQLMHLFLYYTVANFTAFPIVWVAGAAGLISMDVENYGLMLCDAMFKAVFASFLLGGSLLRVEYQSAANLRAIEAGAKESLLDELNRSLSKESRFVASISHELRTPLNGIIGLSENVIQGVYGELNDDLRKVVTTIKKSGSRLHCLVNDLLDFATIKKGKLIIKREKVNLREIVEHVIDLTVPITKWSVKIENNIAQEFPSIDGDPERLIAVFHNLLGNAAKFTEQGIISISAQILDRTSLGPKVQVMVEDTGMGIPQDKLEHIFDEFEQVDSSTTRKYGGTGLGLSIVDKLVKAHNGSIRVESMPGKGSTFAIILPFNQPEEDDTASTLQPITRESGDSDLDSSEKGFQEAASTIKPSKDIPETSLPSSPPGPSLGMEATSLHEGKPSAQFLPKSVTWETLRSNVLPSKQSQMFISDWYPDLTPIEHLKKHAVSTCSDVTGQIEILSVDDDQVNQMVVGGILKSAGYKVTSKLDGYAALEYLESASFIPDLILLDVMMPGISGFEVCETIREKYPVSVLPIIMVSAKSQERDIVQGFKSGSNDYITKPFRHFEVLARIKTQITLKKMWRIQLESWKSDTLLRQMLPEHIINRLRQGERLIADSLPDVTILFSDIVGFTSIAASNNTEDIVIMLNSMFTAFDLLTDKYSVYKVETIGDAYMAVSGHDGSPDHAERMIQMAKAMLQAVYNLEKPKSLVGQIKIRIGMHSGPAYGGVVGRKCLRFCLFGDTVNMASRMESHGFPMRIHVSHETYARLFTRHKFWALGPRAIKGKGMANTYLLKHGDYEEAPLIHQRSSADLNVHLVRQASLGSHLGALDLWCATTILHPQRITKSRNQEVRKSLSCPDLPSLPNSLPLDLAEVDCEAQPGVPVAATMLNMSSEEEAKDGIREDTLLLSHAGKNDEMPLNDHQPERPVECVAERAQSGGGCSPPERGSTPLSVVSSSVGHQPGGAAMMTASMLRKRTWTKEESCIAAKTRVKTNALENLRQIGSSQGRSAEREEHSHSLHDKEGMRMAQQEANTDRGKVSEFEQLVHEAAVKLKRSDGLSKAPSPKPRSPANTSPRVLPRSPKITTAECEDRKRNPPSTAAQETGHTPSFNFQNPLFINEFPERKSCPSLSTLHTQDVVVVKSRLRHVMKLGAPPSPSPPQGEEEASGASIDLGSLAAEKYQRNFPGGGSPGCQKQEEESLVPDACPCPPQTEHGETKVKVEAKISPRMESRRQEQRRKLHSFLSPLHLEHYVPLFLEEEITLKTLETLTVKELQSLSFLSSGAVLRIYHHINEADNL